MIVGIHQPHYFPWIGYFDKMAKADTFVLLDQVQFEKGSPMIRNRIMSSNGTPQYITIMADKHGYVDKEYSDIRTINNKEWTKKTCSLIKAYYQKAVGFCEVFPIVEDFHNRDYETVCEWTIASIKLVCELLKIDTNLILQSSILYDRGNKKSDMDMEICKAIGADVYLSGRGASVEYLDRDKFCKNNIRIVFQNFVHPVYPQINAPCFCPGVSILDMLFNCGIEETKRVFWDGVLSSTEVKPFASN